MENIELLLKNAKIIIGTIGIAITLASFYLYFKTYAKANKEINEGLKNMSQNPVRSNDEAIQIAKTYFDGFNDKAYKVGKHLKTDIELPITIKPQLVKKMLHFITVLLLGIGLVIFNDNETKGKLYKFIELGPNIMYYMGIFLIIVGVWLIVFTLQWSRHKIEFDENEMRLLFKNTVFSLNYSDYKLMVTPSFKHFQFILKPKDSTTTMTLNFQKVLGLLPNQKVTPILITKAIEYDNFHPTKGVEIPS